MTWIVDSRNGSLSITAGSHQNPFILVSEGPALFPPRVSQHRALTTLIQQPT